MEEKELTYNGVTLEEYLKAMTVCATYKRGVVESKEESDFTFGMMSIMLAEKPLEILDERIHARVSAMHEKLKAAHKNEEENEEK